MKGGFMGSKLYVGNLSYDTTEDQIKELMSKSGSVDSVSLIMDKFSGRSKGFAFVEMENDEAAKKATTEANGVEIDGRAIIVNEARPPKHSRGGFGGGGGRPGGGFGGGRGGGGFGGGGRGGRGNDRKSTGRSRY